MKKYYFFFAVVFFVTIQTYAQDIPSDSSVNPNDDSLIYEYDTVVIEKDPLVIKKQILIVNTPIKESPSFSIDFYFSPFLLKPQETFKKKTTFSRTVGGALNIELRKKSVSFGVSHTTLMINEKYTDIENRTFTDTLDIYYVVTGRDTTWVYETKDMERQDTVQRNNLNQYSYLEFPIVFSLSGTKGRITFSANAGGIIGFPIKVNGIKGSTTGISREKIDITSLQTFNFSFFIGGSVGIRVIDRFIIFVKPYLRQGITRVYSSSPEPGKLSGFGTSVGGSFSF